MLFEQWGGSGCRAYGCLHGARSQEPGCVRAPLVRAESRRDRDHPAIVVEGEVAGAIGSLGAAPLSARSPTESAAPTGQGDRDWRPQRVLDG
jgi:hypothetical protein